MKTREWNTESSAWQARSVLDCGSPLPLLNGHENSITPQSARGLAQSKTWRLVVTALAFVMFASITSAQSYSIDWHKIAGGGGTSTGNVYSVSGTIGQHDASAGNAMTGGPYSLTGGFWALAVAVQTPGAPLLTITLNPQLSTIQLSWSPATPGWVLQENLNLATTNWVNSVSGATNPVTVPATAPTKFYRLFKP
jgi:hypothetical protein